MTLSNASRVYAKIVEELKVPLGRCKVSNLEQKLVKYVSNGKPM